MRSSDAPIVEAVGIQTLRQLEDVGAGHLSGVVADQVIDRQSHGLVGDERIVTLAQVAGESQMRPRLHERHIGRHGRVIGAVHLGDDRGDRRIFVAFGIRARGRRQVGGLKYGIGLVIALQRVDRTDDRELVEHGRLFGQMLADHHAGQLRLNRGERAAILQRPARV